MLLLTVNPRLLKRNKDPERPTLVYSLALAEQLGADVCLNPQASATPAEVGEWLKASLPPYGPDIVIDCAGFQSTLQVGSLVTLV